MPLHEMKATLRQLHWTVTLTVTLPVTLPVTLTVTLTVHTGSYADCYAASLSQLANAVTMPLQCCDSSQLARLRHANANVPVAAEARRLQRPAKERHRVVEAKHLQRSTRNGPHR